MLVSLIFAERLITGPPRFAERFMNIVLVGSCFAHGLQAPVSRRRAHGALQVLQVFTKSSVRGFTPQTVASRRRNYVAHAIPPTALGSRFNWPAASRIVR